MVHRINILYEVNLFNILIFSHETKFNLKYCRIGMLRCLVLTEDDKKQRFRKLIHKRREERRKHPLFAMERIRPIQQNISIFTNCKPDNENCSSLTSIQSSCFSEQNEKTHRNKCWSSNQEELAQPPYMGKF